MQSFVHHYGYFGLLVLSILSSACFPIPSEVAYGFAGALCTTAITRHAQFSVWGVIVVGTVGSLIGAVIAYEVARSAGRTIVDRWGKAGVATRFGTVPDANHFTAVAPLADPDSPMVSRLRELAAR